MHNKVTRPMHRKIMHQHQAIHPLQATLQRPAIHLPQATLQLQATRRQAAHKI